MMHLAVLPILLPLLTGAGLVTLHRVPLAIKRAISTVSTLLLLVAVIMLGGEVMAQDHLVYALGSWAPPFGIILVPDRLSVLMLALTATVALAAVLYACRGGDETGAHFHALFHFQLMGINGAFLTGDIFNLFVFFEVLLIASYALLLHGGGVARSRAGLHYVILNLLGSALFLIGVGILYGVTGTLNMADLAERISVAPEANQPLIQTASLLLLVVFGLKAALLPLLFWLPRAYTAASAPVAALFAIMTKVGIYSMLRVFYTVFGFDTPVTDLLVWQWLWPLALATLALGAVGVLGAHSLGNMIAYMVIVSTGTLLATFALGTLEAVTAGLFYLVHTTLLTAAFFLFAELIARQRGAARDHTAIGSTTGDRLLLGVPFFFGATAFAGLPPFSGFVGKALILDASVATGAVWLWPILLGSGLLMLIGLSRAGSQFFWRQQGEASQAQRTDGASLAVVIAMLATSPVLAILAEPLITYLGATAGELLEADQYVNAVREAASHLRGKH